MINNAKIGLLIGTFVGSLIGSVGTILVFKKLGKLEEKKLNEHEEEHVEEVKNYYLERIREIKSGQIEAPNCVETVEKVIKNEAKISDKISEKTPENRSRITYEGLDVKGGDEAVQAFDYSKISREKYTDLKKEYEREEPEIEENPYPVQITKDQFDDEIAYRKENLIYYEQNGIFAGYDDVDVTDVYDEKYFGYDNLSLFGSDQASLDGMSSRNELYLRDRTHNVDFHLIYNSTEDFNKVVNGIG